MKPKVDKLFFLQTVFLWTIFVALCSYSIITSSLINLWSCASLITAFILLLLTTLLTLRFGIYLTITITIIIADALILVIWGNIVPYIQIIPFIASYLLVVNNKKSLVYPYLIAVILITLGESVGILPLLKHPFLEIGLPNLLILMSLQLVSYFIWISTLNLYQIVDKFTALGMDELFKTTSMPFLISLLIKGLYVSILMHFFNNYLNNIVWGAPLSKRNLRILQLLSESDRVEAVKTYSLLDVIQASEIPINRTSLSTIFLSTSKSKILFLILSNIRDNYTKKELSSYTCDLTIVNNNTVLIRFTNYNIPPKKENWSRNLGSMKQFLQITKIGNINIYNEIFFTTELEFNISD